MKQRKLSPHSSQKVFQNKNNIGTLLLGFPCDKKIDGNFAMGVTHLLHDKSSVIFFSV
jgi:hypothetical protein